MEIKTNRFMLGIWFAASSHHDFMLTVWTDDDPKKRKIEWQGEYRVRYYDEEDPRNDPWSGKDRKNFYSMKFFGTEEKCTENTEKMIHAMKTQLPVDLPDWKFDKWSHVPLFSSDPQFIMEKLQEQEWCHMKKMTPEEYEKEYGKKDKNAS